MPMLEEVFKKSGVPTHTFIEPTEFHRVLVALRAPGKSMIIEGPSGIGKTSCIKKAVEQLGLQKKCLFLSARVKNDLEYIRALPSMANLGIVIVDDFHRLADEIKEALTDFVKTLADDENANSKIVLIGINRAGQALVDYAGDLLHRVEVVRFNRTEPERLEELIAKGEQALNCKIGVAADIAKEASGSFAMAQVLAFEACLRTGLLESVTTAEPHPVVVSFPLIKEAVLAELAPRFFPLSREFATGNKFRPEGRAPYLNLLRWLSETLDGVLDTREALARDPALKGSVSQVLEKGHLSKLIESEKKIDEIIHYDQKTGLLTAEDPKFLFYIRHIIWSHFARKIGYFSVAIRHKYDFALSFAGQVRDIAQEISKLLTEREIQVFYDKDEQHRIIAADVEEYLAPIYRSESRFVVALLSKDYPTRIWTKFESTQFKQRFNERSVIPVWFADCPPGMFDASREVGGMSLDPSKDLQPQIAEVVEALVAKLKEDKAEAERRRKEGEDGSAGAGSGGVGSGGGSWGGGGEDSFGGGRTLFGFYPPHPGR